jgi:DNA-binding IclR family transcriptional regulator
VAEPNVRQHQSVRATLGREVYALTAVVLAGMPFTERLSGICSRVGQDTRARSSCVERNNDGMFYVVAYEFSPDGSGTIRTRIGKQATQSSMNPKDIVAVRYWSRWPREVASERVA